jgi:hypothetical protein
LPREYQAMEENIVKAQIQKAGLRLAWILAQSLEVIHLDELDVWRVAQLLIRQRDDPELFAALRVDAMIARGDAAGETAWKRVLAAIRELQRMTTTDRGSVN